MAFVGIEFEEEGSVALVRSTWLTPRKREVFWPPYRLQTHFNKILSRGDEPDLSEWKTFPIKRCLFETDDLDSASKKLRQLECTSDTDSDVEEVPLKRRKFHLPKYIDSDNENGNMVKETDSNNVENCPKENNSSVNNLNLNDNFPICLQPTSGPQSSEAVKNSPIQDKGLQSSSTSTVSGMSASVTSVNDASETSVAAFAEKLLALLEQIKEQNYQILKCIKRDSPDTSPVTSSIDIQTELPFNNEEELKKHEIFLEDKNNMSQLISHLATLGGRNITCKTNNILKHLITNSLGSKYSFYGKRSQKKPFSVLKLKTAVVEAVKRSSPEGTTVREIENCIKVWLKHSPQRLLLETTRRTTQTPKT